MDRLSKGKPAELAERLKVSNDATKAEEVRPTKVYSPEELQKVINKTAPGSCRAGWNRLDGDRAVPS